VPDITVVSPESWAEGLKGMVVSPETTITEVPPITVGLPVIGCAPMIEAITEPIAADVACDAGPWGSFGELAGA
jgi:hypothetical protein